MAGLSITNDRQAKQAESRLDELAKALSSEAVFASLVEGSPQKIIAGVRRSLATEQKELADQIEAYRSARTGDLAQLRQIAGSDLGSQLIVARIAKNLSQKDLGRRIGLQEQAIQRYEAERYRSISLANFQKFASVLGLRFNIAEAKSPKAIWGVPYDVNHAAVGRILKHAWDHGWLKSDESSEERAFDAIRRTIGDHVVRHGTPSLLRTGLNVIEEADDLSLLAWKAHVTRRAEQIIREERAKFKTTDIRWLRDLVKLSSTEAALGSVQTILLDHGIVLIYEPQITGMKVDGASFLIDEVPVIGMTLRKDSVDNFWFTLLHELAHVFLHQHTGLKSGFFDDSDCMEIDELEQEANEFARNWLIPDEVWDRSPAKISKTTKAGEALAQSLGIHPAIVFGRIRMERRNYAIYSDKIGSGAVRKRLLDQERGRSK